MSRIICKLPAVRPPSTASTAPEIQAASSEHRKRAAPTTSSGSPMRPSGYHLATRSKTLGSFRLRSYQAGVLSVPGAMAFARMPKGP